MSEKYTEQARRVLYFARYEAHQAGAPVADTGHILLGLVLSDSPILADIFARGRVQIDEVRQDLDLRPVADALPAPASQPSWSRDVRLMLEKFAPEEAERLSSARLGPEHLFLGLLHLEDSVAGRFLSDHGLELPTARERVVLALKRQAFERRKESKPGLDEFTQDLTALAAEGAFDPLVGREEELERVVQILSRRHKNNPILLGEPGVGKTALIEGLAQRVASGQVPDALAHKRILALDLSLVIAGTSTGGSSRSGSRGS
jgi:ATP-dependent Clp protease ATP-binding subunit ClpC